ncbi:MAG: hypothetical protein JNJ60_09605 [Rhodocyclaceae bacterium]|nr:hypothetical protein [Rhodocyclaceae bacterium]
MKRHDKDVPALAGVGPGTAAAWHRQLRGEERDLAAAMDALVRDARHRAYRPLWLVIARRASGAPFLRWRGPAGEVKAPDIPHLLAGEPVPLRTHYTGVAAHVEFLNARISATYTGLKLAAKLSGSGK